MPRRHGVNLTACKRREHCEKVSCNPLRSFNRDFLWHDISAGAFALDLALARQIMRLAIAIVMVMAALCRLRDRRDVLAGVRVVPAASK